jgi:hypothetical protein
MPARSASLAAGSSPATPARWPPPCARLARRSACRRRRPSRWAGYRVLPVVARISPAFEPVPDPGEVAEVFEVPLAFLMAPANLARIDIEFAGRMRQVLEFRQHGDAGDLAADARRIWGATASILANFRDRLEAVR